MRDTARMSYDLERVRAAFPALSSGTAYFDGPGGSQTPSSVAAAVAGAMTAGLANRGRVTAAERRADDIVTHARQAVADLVGGQPGGVVFGRSMTSLTYDLARTLAQRWSPGDEVVVSRLDHDANISPWVHAAELAGATVRWADFDAVTGELPAEAVSHLVNERTRLVAVTGASNLIGTRPDLPAIAAATHDAGALLCVDGVHLTAHAPIDIASMGADFYACSPYKFFGPHHGMLVAEPALLDTLHPAKLTPSTDEVPERFEQGTLPYELLAGTTTAVDFIADLASDAGSRRDRVLASMTAVERYEDALFERLLDGLGRLDGVTRHAAPTHSTPTVLFAVAGHTPREVHEHLAKHDVNAPGGSFYALEASRHLGLGDTGGTRAGLAPYTDADDVDRMLAGVAELVA